MNYQVTTSHQYSQCFDCYFRIEEAADAFMDLVKDDSKNGVILKLSKHEGKQYCTLAVQNL